MPDLCIRSLCAQPQALSGPLAPSAFPHFMLGLEEMCSQFVGSPGLPPPHRLPFCLITPPAISTVLSTPRLVGHFDSLLLPEFHGEVGLRAPNPGVESREHFSLLACHRLSPGLFPDSRKSSCVFSGWQEAALPSLQLVITNLCALSSSSSLELKSLHPHPFAS